MKVRVLYLSGLLMSVFSLEVFAASSASIQISRIATQDLGIAILYAEGGWGSAANNSCSTGTGVLAIDTNTEGGKSMLSTVLTAATAQKNVIVNTNDSKCISVGGLAPAIKRVDILY